MLETKSLKFNKKFFSNIGRFEYQNAKNKIRETFRIEVDFLSLT